MKRPVQVGAESSTIVAEATPPGRGGVSIVRLSGPRALEIATGIASLADRTQVTELVPGRLVRADFLAENKAFDSGMVVLFHGPYSFTGEDVVELHLHGNPVIVQRAIEVCHHLGARTAEPGEFLRRRFLAGKVDLTQVEALSALLVAEEEELLSVASRQLDGDLRQRLDEVRTRMVGILARLELELDFSEESYEFVDREEVRRFLSETRDFVSSLQRAHRSLEQVQAVPNLLLLGPPNAGKSSLFNALIGFERSIAHEEAGTTRDYVSESIRIRDHRVRLIDTAGIRTPDSLVEAEGIDRALGLVGSVDLLIWMVDLSGDALDREILSVQKHAISEIPIILVGTKRDLVEEQVIERFLDLESDLFASRHVVSLLDIGTLDGLITAVINTLGSSSTFGDLSAIVTRRQLPILSEIVGFLESTLDSHFSGDFVSRFDPLLCSTDLRQILPLLDALVGETTNEDVLDSVFLQFCIGK